MPPVQKKRTSAVENILNKQRQEEADTHTSTEGKAWDDKKRDGKRITEMERNGMNSKRASTIIDVRM